MNDKKQRLDEVLIKQGIARDKNHAFIIVTEGRIFVEGQKAVSPAQMVVPGARMVVKEDTKYVGRGAYKLEAALHEFDIAIRDTVCADIGAAIGGFTQVLLERGAKKVYAIDTAKGKLAPKLRDDPRVVVMETTDVRDLDSLPEGVDFVTIDVSLIPLENILPQVGRFLKEDGSVVALFKPQYQTRDPRHLRHGIVTDDDIRKLLLDNFMVWAGKHGWRVLAQLESPIRGSEGNVEYLLELRVKN